MISAVGCSFRKSVDQLYVFGKMTIQVLCPFFKPVVCFFNVELYEFFIYFGIIRYITCKYFLPFSLLPFHFTGGFTDCAKAFHLMCSQLFIDFCFPCLRRQI